MRSRLLLAGLALAVVIPAAASAQETCEERAANRATGTAIGAVAGALLGAGVAGHHEKGTGAVVGGLAGALVGNQLAKGPPDCRHAYGWYDDGGRWHPNAVDPAQAYGYYDRGGQWVEGRPVAYRPPPPPPPQPVAWDDGGWRDEAGDWPGYPQFRGLEAHIRDEIHDGVREDLIAPDDAHELMDQLRDIRRWERRAFQTYGWRLPYDDGARIQARLVRLDRQVDAIRAEP